MAQIVNFHHYGRDQARLTAEFGDDWLYVGRQNPGLQLQRSPLANPFSSQKGANASFSTNPIADYKRWLWERIKALDKVVIQELERIGPDTALVCWCAPKPCHAEVIAAAAMWWQKQKTLRTCTEPITHALSVQQPWGWLLTRPDLNDAERWRAHFDGRIKDIENRDWNTSRRGWFYIHVGKKFDEVGYRYAVAHYPDIELPAPSEYERGGIIGMANLVDVVTESPNRWFAGKFGFVVHGARPLPLVPCPGRLNFFEVNEEVLANVSTQGG